MSMAYIYISLDLLNGDPDCGSYFFFGVLVKRQKLTQRSGFLGSALGHARQLQLGIKNSRRQEICIPH